MKTQNASANLSKLDQVPPNNGKDSIFVFVLDKKVNSSESSWRRDAPLNRCVLWQECVHIGDVYSFREHTFLRKCLPAGPCPALDQTARERAAGILFGLNLQHAAEKSGRFWVSELLPESSAETEQRGEADTGWVLGRMRKPCDLPGTEAGMGEIQGPLWLSP